MNAIRKTLVVALAAITLSAVSRAQSYVDLTRPTGDTITESSYLSGYPGTKAFDNGDVKNKGHARLCVCFRQPTAEQHGG